MTKLLVGTRKGLFALEGEPGSPFEVTARAFAGDPVEYALRDPRSGRVHASVTSPFYGPKIFYTDDLTTDWEQAAGVSLPGRDEVLERIAVGISAAGVWLTDDGGATWRSGNAGIVPRYLPEDIPEDEIGLCVHRLQRAPMQPERIFMQFHGGVYRSDDGGESWQDIARGLPSDFGFPLAVDPADADSAYVIPLA